jgi:hypothetical protein
VGFANAHILPAVGGTYRNGGARLRADASHARLSARELHRATDGITWPAGASAIRADARR